MFSEGEALKQNRFYTEHCSVNVPAAKRIAQTVWAEQSDESIVQNKSQRLSFKKRILGPNHLDFPRRPIRLTLRSCAVRLNEIWNFYLWGNKCTLILAYLHSIPTHVLSWLAAGHQCLAPISITTIRCCFLSLLTSWEGLWWQLEWSKRLQTIASVRGNSNTQLLKKSYFVTFCLLLFVFFILACLMGLSWCKFRLHTSAGNNFETRKRNANVQYFYKYVLFLVHGWKAHHSPLLGSWTRGSPCSQVWTWSIRTPSTSKWWIMGLVAIMSLTLTMLQ